MATAVIDFVSRECKHGIHQRCCGKWEGLGFEIICSCKCGHKKTALALTEVEGPLANAYESIRQPSTREVTQENDH
jgi:hypothetical protein